MNHSLLTFLLGRDGRHLETFLSGSEPEAMAARIRRHVELDFVKGFLLRPPALAPAYEAFAAGDYAAAFQAYRGSANRGDAAAQNNLGILYEVGAVVPADSAQAETSAERRVGTECVRTCWSRCSREHEQKKNKT